MLCMRLHSIQLHLQGQALHRLLMGECAGGSAGAAAAGGASSAAHGLRTGCAAAPSLLCRCGHLPPTPVSAGHGSSVSAAPRFARLNYLLVKVSVPSGI